MRKVGKSTDAIELVSLKSFSSNIVAHRFVSDNGAALSFSKSPHLSPIPSPCVCIFGAKPHVVICAL